MEGAKYFAIPKVNESKAYFEVPLMVAVGESIRMGNEEILIMVWIIVHFKKRDAQRDQHLG